MATGTTNVGFEEKLWQVADKLRSNMDAAEYKHVVLGLIFLKYVSDSFEEKYRVLLEEGYGDEEDRDEYLADNIFWVPREARWSEIQKYANSADIGSVIDNAMEVIENENNSLKGVLTKNYSRAELDKTRLGELVTLFTNIEIGSTAAQERDVLGRVYEYFLSKFASAEGKLGGEFYTPSCIVRTLVEMIEPFEGQIFDPACGSGGMFCQSARFVREHQGNVRDISIFGQESNPTTWKLAKMNLAIRQLEANLGKHNADSFHDDQHKTLKANYILANHNSAALLQTLYQEQFGDVVSESTQGHLSDLCSYSRDRVSVSRLNANTYFSTENMLPGKAGATEAASLPTTPQTTACHKGDTLISNIRPYFKKIVYCEDECGCSTDVLCFTPIQSRYVAYLFSTLYADKFFAFMVAGSKGTKMPRGDKQQIMSYPIVLPSDEELDEFNDLALPILTQIHSNRGENKRLSAVRDALLPKLMSGKIDVSAIQL